VSPLPGIQGDVDIDNVVVPASPTNQADGTGTDGVQGDHHHPWVSQEPRDASLARATHPGLGDHASGNG
jgi:hypothetical protein